MSIEKLTKMSGYLEKRGKLSLMGRWKKWWCVLEGQLLIYYKSRIEYTNLSPCCGSLNMALVKNVQPHRTKNKEKQQQWFHALVGVLPQNSYLSPLLWFSTNSVEYRRRSERKKKSKHKDKPDEHIEIIERDESQISKSDNDISNSNPTNGSQFSIFEDPTLAEIQHITSQEDRIEIQAAEISNSMECNLQESYTCVRIPPKCSSEINIRRYSSYHSIINSVFISERIPNRRSISCECIFTQHRTSSIEQCNFLSSCSIRSDGGSQQINRKDDTEECKKSKRKSRRKRRHDSKKYNTLSKKSMSFLRKIFKKKMESQNQPTVESISSEEIIEETSGSRLLTLENSEEHISESPESDINEINTIERTENDETAPIKIEEITPCNDSVEKYIANTSSNNETESESSSDSESNIDVIENSQDALPALPVKNVNCLSYSRHNFKDVNSNYQAKVRVNHTDAKESISMDNCASIELDSLLLQLNVLNTQSDKSHESLEFHNNIIEDPDYDIPRPHASLISSDDDSTHEKNRLDFVQDGNSTNQRYDSLSIDMAPDSLEMPWLLNDTKYSINYWTTKKEFDLCLENDSESDCDYHDSLNSNKYNF